MLLLKTAVLFGEASNRKSTLPGKFLNFSIAQIQTLTFKHGTIFALIFYRSLFQLKFLGSSDIHRSGIKSKTDNFFVIGKNDLGFDFTDINIIFS
jgi:hypothetical protein